MNINAPGQQIDQMLRQTRGHHVELSKMADVKANMMLTVASLVIPLSVGHVADPNLRWAAITAMSFCVLTIALAAYASMPKLRLPSAGSGQTDISNPGFNLLFFGDFIGMDYPQFAEQMERVMNDHSKTYEVQVREIYNIGIYLARRKYRFVRLAYISFICGLIASGIILLLTNLRLFS
ncbi:hypothetical protein HY256_00710 [Candidatus Sumerlaeota bacterium]|nr:hypothetical protein [Candidatus Sumerlaeota bacterium]